MVFSIVRPAWQSRHFIMAARLTSLLTLALLAIGCQGASPTVSNRALLAHLPGVDFSGLQPMQAVNRVHASLSVPSQWQPRVQSNPLYTNEQWKSPSGYTGIGVIHIHLPLPLNAQSLLWLARLEYSKKAVDGKALGQWTDALGRPWFEAENDKYHVRGYAVTSGMNAWIVYFGYKTTRPANAAELNLAARSVETVLPHTSDVPPFSPQPAIASTPRPVATSRG